MKTSTDECFPPRRLAGAFRALSGCYQLNICFLLFTMFRSDHTGSYPPPPPLLYVYRRNTQMNNCIKHVDLALSLRLSFALWVLFHTVLIRYADFPVAASVFRNKGFAGLPAARVVSSGEEPTPVVGFTAECLRNPKRLCLHPKDSLNPRVDVLLVCAQRMQMREFFL